MVQIWLEECPIVVREESIFLAMVRSEHRESNNSLLGDSVFGPDI